MPNIPHDGTPSPKGPDVRYAAPVNETPFPEPTPAEWSTHALAVAREQGIATSAEAEHAARDAPVDVRVVQDPPKEFVVDCFMAQYSVGPGLDPVMIVPAKRVARSITVTVYGGPARIATDRATTGLGFILSQGTFTSKSTEPLWADSPQAATVCVCIEVKRELGHVTKASHDRHHWHHNG